MKRKPNLLKFTTGLMAMIIAVIAVSFTVNADSYVGVNYIKSGKINYFTKSEYTGNVLSSDDNKWFEGSLFYGKTKTVAISSKCKYYTWAINDNGFYTKKITKSEFMKQMPKSSNGKYYIKKNGVKYYDKKVLKIKIKDKKVVSMTIEYAP